MHYVSSTLAVIDATLMKDWCLKHQLSLSWHSVTLINSHWQPVCLSQRGSSYNHTYCNLVWQNLWMKAILTTAGHEDGGCMIYDITAGRTLQFFKPHSLDCRSVRFSPNSRFLLSGSYDASIVLMDLKQNLESAIPPHFVVGEHRDKVIQCRWHPHALAFVSSSADRTVNLWAVKHR